MPAQSRVELVISEIILPTDIQSVYKAVADSTGTVLGANAIYTGVTIDSQPTNGNSVTRIYGGYRSDQSGTLVIQFSDDGTTWNDIVTLAAAVSGFFEHRFYMRYARLKYTNGATAQTAFKLVATNSAL